MGTPIYPAGITAVRAETLALSSTVASLGIPPGYQQALLYSPTVDFRLHLNPGIIAAFFYDVSATIGARFTDFTSVLTDRDTATGTSGAMNSMQTGDRLYVCVDDPIGGLRTTIGNANSTSSTMTVKYSKSDATFASISVTDGTTSGGATLAITGALTWSVPSDWQAQTLKTLGVTDQGAAGHGDVPAALGFWLEVTVGTAVDSTTSITELWTQNKNTDRMYLRASTEYTISLDRRRIGAIDAILASGTDTLQVDWVKN